MNRPASENNVHKFSTNERLRNYVNTLKRYKNVRYINKPDNVRRIYHAILFYITYALNSRTKNQLIAYIMTILFMFSKTNRKVLNHPELNRNVREPKQLYNRMIDIMRKPKGEPSLIKKFIRSVRPEKELDVEKVFTFLKSKTRNQLIAILRSAIKTTQTEMYESNAKKELMEKVKNRSARTIQQAFRSGFYPQKPITKNTNLGDPNLYRRISKNRVFGQLMKNDPEMYLTLIKRANVKSIKLNTQTRTAPLPKINRRFGEWYKWNNVYVSPNMKAFYYPNLKTLKVGNKVYGGKNLNRLGIPF